MAYDLRRELEFQLVQWKAINLSFAYNGWRGEGVYDPERRTYSETLYSYTLDRDGCEQVNEYFPQVTITVSLRPGADSAAAYHRPDNYIITCE